MPLLMFGLVALGVVILALGRRQVVHTAPEVIVVPSNEADESRITNTIQAIHAVTTEV